MVDPQKLKVSFEFYLKFTRHCLFVLEKTHPNKMAYFRTHAVDSPNKFNYINPIMKLKKRQV